MPFSRKNSVFAISPLRKIQSKIEENSFKEVNVITLKGRREKYGNNLS